MPFIHRSAGQTVVAPGNQGTSRLREPGEGAAPKQMYRRGLLQIWVLLGDLGKGSRKREFALDWELSESRGRSMIAGLGNLIDKMERPK